MDEKNKNRVLVCPLGWGLGHASRLIPIINRFIESNVEVIAAGDKLQMQYISTYFPNIKTLILPSFRVKLLKGTNQTIPLIRIAISLPYHIIKEHFALKRIVKDHEINLIISDNRYGLYCKGIKSGLITHQLRVLFPKPFKFLEPLGVLFIRIIAQKFTYCWIPDYAGDDNLAGFLSHPNTVPKNAKYIGLLSRFQGNTESSDSMGWDLVGIASGPSPHRELFIELIVGIAKRKNLRTLIIKGAPTEGTNIIERDGIFYTGHFNDTDFQKAVRSSKYLITRAGYSTIMDLVTLEKSCLIVPTPGQTEQEYLAKYLSEKGFFKTCKQADLEKVDISIALTEKHNKKFPNVLFGDDVFA